MIKMMKKSKIAQGLFAALFCSFAALAIVSCDVGLGESIDTSAPTVSIVSPASSSSIGGNLVIKGVCSDDKSLDRVVVKVKDANKDAAETYTYTSKVNGNDWSVVLEKENFPDGTYTADVVVYDSAGRVSGTATRVFDVDNTPPVFCASKPNSILVDSPAAYGRDVVVSGEIADDHTVQKMDVRVFKIDGSSATEVTSSLYKTTFTGFETAGGTEITIAKYFSEDDAPAAGSDDYPLYMNYKAMYDDLGATLGDTMYFYIFPYFTDEAGNSSDKAYIQGTLKQLAKAALGVDTTSDSLQTAQLKKILNGSYTLSDFNESQLETMLQILNGEYDQSGLGKEYKYFASLERSSGAAEIASGQSVPFAMSLNANNAPMYEFGGMLFDKSEGTFAEIRSGGQTTIKVSPGLDGNAIRSNTIRVYLWECDGDLKLASGLDLNDPSTASYSSDPSVSNEKHIDVMGKEGDDNAIKSLDEFSDDTVVTNATYSVTLPDDIEAGNHYLMTASGYDVTGSSGSYVNNNKLYSAATYAFMVATTGDAPKVEFEERFFVQAKAIDKTKAASYNAKIEITDKTGTGANEGKGSLKESGNWVKVTPVLYKGYAKTKAYLSDDDILQTLDAIKFEGSSDERPIKNGTEDGAYYIEVPMNIFDLSGSNAEDNYTVALKVQAKNTGATSDETAYIFWADNKAPVLAITAPVRAEGAAQSEPIYIYENDKNITVAGTSEDPAYSYTARGTWSDISGSGSCEIWYAWGSPDQPSLVWTQATGNAVDGVTYYEKQGDGLYCADTTIAIGASVAGKYTLSVGAGWTAISGAAKSASLVNWNQSLVVANSDGQKLNFVAVDQTGNLSDVTSVDGITFDFAPPAITIPNVNPYYNANGAVDSKHSFEIEISDASGLQSLEVTAERADNASSQYAEVASGNKGYTLSVAGDKTSATISLKADGTGDGLWKFTVAAKDGAERQSQKDFAFVLDTKAPERVYYDDSKNLWIAIGTDGSADSWNNSENLTISGRYNEATSGLDNVEYVVTPAGGSALEQQSVVFAGATGDKVLYQFSPIGLVEGENSIEITATDLAGNSSSPETYTIKVDTTAPQINTAFYTYNGTDASVAAGRVMSSGEKDMTIYGTLSETLSGIKSVELKIGEQTVSTSVKYTTDDSLTGSSAFDDFKSVEWKNYSASENTSYTGFMAVIPAAKLSGLDSGDADLYAVATDMALNETKQRKFGISLDNDPPQISVLSPENGASVNGSVTFSGAVDDSSLNVVKAYWSLSDSAEINESRAVNPDYEIKDGGGNPLLSGTYSWVIKDLALSVADNNAKKITFIDGTEYSGEAKTVYLKILASDTAANQSVKVQKYVIDPEADRPKITLTTATISGMGSSNYVWYDSQKLEGTIDDDDGISQFSYSYSTDGGTNWTDGGDITVSSGAWTADVPADNNYQIKFYVKDSAGTEFVSVKSSGSDIYLSPIIAGKDATISLADTNLYLKIDTNRPEYSDLVYKTSDSVDGTYEVGDDTYKLGTVGGQKKFIQLEFDAKDANGISKASFTIDGTEYSVDVSAADYDSVNDSYRCVISGIDVSGLESKTYSAELKLTGSFAADVSSDMISVSVDNTPPEVTPLAPDANSVNGNVTVYGMVDYAAKMQYALSLDGENAPAPEDYSDINGAAQTWFIYFDAGISSQTETHDKTLEWFIIKEGVTTAAAIANQSFDQIVPIYAWIKALDDVGNVYNKPHLINYDPQGGRPTFTYSNPDKDEARIGGRNIKLIGGVDDDEEVKAAFLQIICAQHPLDANSSPAYAGGTSWGTATYSGGEFTFALSANDLDYLKAAGYTVVKMRDYPTLTEWSGSGTPSDYGILTGLKSGSSWNLLINENGEFNPLDGTNELILCGYAFDGSKLSLPMYREVLVDADSPLISNQYLKQYDGNVVAASREYSEKMYVKGDWNLEFDLTDGDEVAKVFIGQSSSSAAEAKAAAVTQREADSSGKETVVFDSNYCQADGEGGFHAKLSLDSGDGVGYKYIYVWFADKKGNYSDYAFAINYDNINPALTITSLDDDVKNSDGYYSVAAKVVEDTVNGKNQSGFDKFVIYFKRNNKVYDPMISKKLNGADNPDNYSDVSALSQGDDGLYWFSQAIEARDADNLDILTLSQANAHIRAGGLVKIGGAIYTIAKVSSDKKTLTLDGNVESSFTTAQFAYGQVIDNNKSEFASGAASSEEGFGYGYPLSIDNDDGDGMVEEAKIQGTTCNLSALINSRNIPDGTIDIYYTVFDKAGNYAKGSVIGAYVSNNAPRLANVTVASDYNYDGIYSDSESRSYYKTSLTDWSKAETSVELGSEAHPWIAAKGDVQVTPEILGGNGTLTWTWKYPNTSGVATSAAGETLSTDSPTEENALRTLNAIKLPSLTLKNAKVGAGEYAITILDSTDGGGQKASISLYMKNDVNDIETPVAKTKRFFWKSLKNNSVYGSSAASTFADLQGHIELEETFSDAAGNETTYSTPKVSGKIVIKGTAFDNAGISQIKITVPGILNSATIAASCDLSNVDPAARWTQTKMGDLAENGYHFALDADESGNVKERYTNTGHFVSWTLELDTEKYNSGTAPAKEGVNFVLGIVDKNGKTSSAAANSGMTVYAMEEQAAAGKYYAEERFALADESDSFESADYTSDEFETFVAADIAEESDVEGVNKYSVTPVAANYTMDIVPYITRVETSLSAIDSTNGVTDRSSLGHYPVYIYKNSTETKTNLATSAKIDGQETVKVYGFNLNGAKYGESDLAYNNAGYVTLNSSNITSGAFALTVGGVSTLNNTNNNDAHGSYAKTTSAAGGDYDVYSNYCNRQPNNANNNNLTDDVAFDVWQLNNMAAAPMSGRADDPQMAINPSDGKIGFAFSNGSSAFTMPNSTYSWTYFAYDYDMVRYVGLNYDPQGNAWAAATGQDTHSGGGDPFFMETTRYRQVGGQQSKDENANDRHRYNDVTDDSAWKLERTCIVSATNTMQDRIQSPAFANTTSGVYLAYYYVGTSNAEIRFRAGKISSMNDGNAFDMFQNDGASNSTAYKTDNVQLVAGGTGNAYHGAKPYVSMAAIDGGATIANDVVVMVWQDGEKMLYGYLTNPSDQSRKNDKTASGWTIKEIFTDVTGEYCQIAVDKVGGVHIAAYDSNEADVWYAYLPAYDSAVKKVCKVDSYDSTGVYLTLDAALDANGYPAPQIGFYSMASARPKFARWNADKGSLAAAASIDGTDSNDSYTGNWEVSNIPTASNVRKSNTASKVKQNINVGVWKGANGKLTKSQTGNSYCIGSATGGTAGTNADNKGDVYGNGTSNAVLSYTYGSDSAAFIETAQRLGDND